MAASRSIGQNDGAGEAVGVCSPATKPIGQSHPSATSIVPYFVPLRTKPDRGSDPKCLDPGDAKVSVMLEYGTSVPPVMSIVTSEGETGAAPPLTVMVAVPVISIPPLANVVTTPLRRVMWWVWAPLAAGSKFPPFRLKTQPSDSSIFRAAKKFACEFPVNTIDHGP